MARANTNLKVVEDDHLAQLTEVEKFAANLDEELLQCREMGHNWRPHTAFLLDEGGFERVLRCPRCKSKRVQQITHRGIVVSSHYEYPEGYIHKGLGRISGEGRGLLRLESINRTVAKATEKQDAKKDNK